MLDLDVEITAEPAAMREAIDHLGDRERATLHSIQEAIDLRDEAASQAVADGT
jgi:hypothetical protein